MNTKGAGAQFRFKKNDVIGTADAEYDEFLSDCFIDSGDLTTLRDCRNSKRIILGRTGAGKSALLKILHLREENVIQLPPENLALNYLANSEVIHFFEDAGTNLDVFYQLLWRHVLAVELIKYKYKINNDVGQRTFLNSLTQLFLRDKAKQAAIEYLRTWGETFWNETEYRVKEVASKLEEQLKAALGGSNLFAKFEAGGTLKLTEEERLEVVNRGARVVNQVQIKALADVLRLLSEDVFNDPLESYYITIDDLDSRWVEDGLKYKLVRALIETVKTFRQVGTVKIIVALRIDLLQRVITATRDSGFQSEKYESLYLKIRWSQQELVDMLNQRVSRLVRQRYTTKPISLSDLFPSKIHKISFLDYLLQRTFLRPRDAILFVNECLERSMDRQQVTVQVVSDAEATYSEKRVHSLQEEWGAVYPKISVCIDALIRRPNKFPVSELSEESLRVWIYDSLLRDIDSTDPVVKVANSVMLEEKGSFHLLRLSLLDALYTVGVVGIKPDATSECFWSWSSDHSLSHASVKPQSIVSIHPTFWRALGTKPPN
ncbi:MAG: hypothetical protein Q8K74_01695 [Candidatus Nitrotoga sp.]|nr:hypothetical protein [Candidatus Nitrotoga sp.]MDP1854749.1 hypothetical protein [Candidatus Nitrotoga sp.]